MNSFNCVKISLRVTARYSGAVDSLRNSAKYINCRQNKGAGRVGVEAENQLSFAVSDKLEIKKLITSWQLHGSAYCL